MKRILFLSIGMFALGVDAYIIAGLLPQVSQTFHISSAQSGQAVTVFTLCYAIAAPVFSVLLANKPIRTILLTALAVFSIANAASALSGTLSVLLISRAIAGIGAGLFAPIAIAASAMLVKPEQKGRALSLTLGGMSCGTVIGVPAGLFISSYFGWSGALWFVTLVGVIAIVGVGFGCPNIPVSPPPSLKQRFAMMYDTKVSARVTVSFLTAVASLGLYTYMAPIVFSNIAIHSITPYIWVWGVGGVIGSFSIGSLIDKTHKPNQLLMGILAILALSLLLLPWAISMGYLLFLPILLWGAMGWSSLAPQQHALIKLQPEHSAAVLGLNSSCNYLGGAVGSLLGGVFIGYGGNVTQLPVWAGVIVLLSLGLHITLNRKREKSASMD